MSFSVSFFISALGPRSSTSTISVIHTTSVPWGTPVVTNLLLLMVSFFLTRSGKLMVAVTSVSPVILVTPSGRIISKTRVLVSSFRSARFTVPSSTDSRSRSLASLPDTQMLSLVSSSLQLFTVAPPPSTRLTVRGTSLMAWILTERLTSSTLVVIISASTGSPSVSHRTYWNAPTMDSVLSLRSTWMIAWSIRSMLDWGPATSTTVVSMTGLSLSAMKPSGTEPWNSRRMGTGFLIRFSTLSCRTLGFWLTVSTATLPG